jgi:hypothetical protein
VVALGFLHILKVSHVRHGSDQKTYIGLVLFLDDFISYAELDTFFNFDEARLDIVRNPNASYGSFAGLKEAVSEVSLESGLGLHRDGLFGEGGDRIILKTNDPSLLVFGKDMIGDFNEGSDRGGAGVSPVHLNLWKSNGVINGFVFPGVRLGFDWLDELPRGPRDKEPARTGAGCERDSFVFQISWDSCRGRVFVRTGTRGRSISVGDGMFGGEGRSLRMRGVVDALVSFLEVGFCRVRLNVGSWCSEESVSTCPEISDGRRGQFFLLWISKRVFTKDGDGGQRQFNDSGKDLRVVLVSRECFEPCVRFDFDPGFGKLELGPETSF